VDALYALVRNEYMPTTFSNKKIIFST
jgi:hypothetical protein